MVWIGGLVLLNLYTPNLFVVTLSYPMDMVLMLVLLVAACALIFLRKEKRLLSRRLYANDFRYTWNPSTMGLQREFDK